MHAQNKANCAGLYALSGEEFIFIEAEEWKLK